MRRVSTCPPNCAASSTFSRPGSARIHPGIDGSSAWSNRPDRRRPAYYTRSGDTVSLNCHILIPAVTFSLSPADVHPAIVRVANIRGCASFVRRARMKFYLNGRQVDFDGDKQTPLLWVL